VFLDRDGTLIEDTGYPLRPEQIRILGGTVRGLDRLAGAGYKLVVITNQSAVARGLLTEAELTRFHEALDAQLNMLGVHVDAYYACPHHPDPAKAVRQDLAVDCECRKPRPGMILRAAEDLGLDLGASWVVGDSWRDVGAGRAAGVRTIKLPAPPGLERARPPEVDPPDAEAANLDAAADVILGVAAPPERRPAAPLPAWEPPAAPPAHEDVPPVPHPEAEEELPAEEPPATEAPTEEWAEEGWPEEERIREEPPEEEPAEQPPPEEEVLGDLEEEVLEHLEEEMLEERAPQEPPEETAPVPILLPPPEEPAEAADRGEPQEAAPAAAPPGPQAPPPPPRSADDGLLREVLTELRRSARARQAPSLSLLRLLAYVLQAAALFSAIGMPLVIDWTMPGQDKMLYLQIAILLQLMVVTLLVVERKS
jgi:D-glycero-D-manno-heptose 1,7-bisphosphate phosphatase